MSMAMAKACDSCRTLPKGYALRESDFGGIYFEVGDYASEDYRSRRQAIAALRAHCREAEKASRRRYLAAQ